MTYTIRERESGDELVDSNGNVVYTWGSGYVWPDESAIDAALEDAGIGAPQKSLFKTLFVGPDFEPRLTETRE